MKFRRKTRSTLLPFLATKSNVASALLLVWTGFKIAIVKVSVLTLDASSGKRNVTVWCPSVRLSRRHILTETHQGAPCNAGSVHFGPTVNTLNRHTCCICVRHIGMASAREGSHQSRLLSTAASSREITRRVRVAGGSGLLAAAHPRSQMSTDTGRLLRRPRRLCRHRPLLRLPPVRRTFSSLWSFQSIYL